MLIERAWLSSWEASLSTPGLGLISRIFGFSHLSPLITGTWCLFQCLHWQLLCCCSFHITILQNRWSLVEPKNDNLGCFDRFRQSQTRPSFCMITTHLYCCQEQPLNQQITGLLMEICSQHLFCWAAKSVVQ